MDKQDFKIGSLDQLMTLNENAQKLDTSLENVCKKIEKVSFETMKEPTNELQYIPKDRSGPSNPSKYFATIFHSLMLTLLSLCCSELQTVHHELPVGPFEI